MRLLMVPMTLAHDHSLNLAAQQVLMEGRQQMLMDMDSLAQAGLEEEPEEEPIEEEEAEQQEEEARGMHESFSSESEGFLGDEEVR